MFYDKICTLSDGQYNVNTSDATMLALISIEGTGMSLGGLLLLVTIIRLAFSSAMTEHYVKIQLQICISAFCTQLLIGIGFLISPCQPLEMTDEEAFLATCKTLSALQLVFILSSFSWKVLEAGFICHQLAKKCTQEIEKRKRKSTKTRQPITDLSQKALSRTFSKDFNFQRSSLKSGQTFKPQVDEATETLTRAWYIRLFSKKAPPFWAFAIAGYLPPIGMMGLSFATVPQGGTSDGQESTLDEWLSGKGLDIYCWPGVRSKMIYYMIAAVIMTTFAIVYLRYRAVNMVRLLRSGTLSETGPDRTVSSFIKWQRQNSGLERSVQIDDFNIRSSIIVTFVMLCTWVFGTLQSVLVWGLAIPFGTLCFLQGLVLFLFNAAKKFSSIFLSQ